MSEEEKQELFKEHKGLSIYYDTYVNVKEYYKLHQENKQLKDIINKAIEYIEDEAYLDYEREISHDLYDSQIFKLIEILKEDNKEEK